MDATLPKGYRRTSAAGLIVPADAVLEREVWTRDEARLLERATKLLEARGVALYLRCTHDDCADAPIARERAADGGLHLRCAHKDRVLSKSL